MLRSAPCRRGALVIDPVFPPCPLRATLARQGGLCVACWGRLAIPGDPACALCQRPLGEEHRDDGT
jgi:predicted amidophosphoribosyltransferase